MKFVDEVTIAVKAGKGGAGSRHFRREKFVPYGGPDGGNGGAGGSVYLVGDQSKRTLIDFRYERHLTARDGASGGGGRKDGKAGDDLVVPVPAGTEVYNADTGELIADIREHGEKVQIAAGGRGGKGNAFFKSATNQTPEHFQPGEPGAELTVTLSLKLIADVGLVGFPNAGKSMLISRVSAARPKVADYPFTTLEPVLGLVKARSGRSFVMADIPGLIPGAHLGKGLGHTFLKHIERTSLIAHVVDISETDENGEPTSVFVRLEKIQEELKLYSDLLASKPQLAILTKIDIAQREWVAGAEAELKSRGFRVFPVSSATGEGLPELSEALADEVYLLSNAAL